MRSTTRPTASICALTLLAAAVPAAVCSADIITARLDEVAPKRTVSLSKNSGVSFEDVGAGTSQFTRLGGDYSGPGADGEFEAYCIQLTQSITWGETYDFETREPELSPVPGSGMGTARADLLAELYGRFFAPGTTSRDDAAAFQLAVWEIVHDDGADLTTGLIQVEDTGVWFGLAQTWLSALDGTGPHADLLAMTHPDKQDHIILIPNAPAAGLMLVAGLFGGASRKRRV
jgi:hypothetical protein